MAQVAEAIAFHPDLQRYLEMHAHNVTRLFRRVREAARAEHGAIQMYGFANPLTGWLAGYDLARLGEVADGFITPYATNPAEVRRIVGQLRAILPDQPLVGGVRALWPQMNSSLDSVVGIAASGRTPYTVAAIREARRLGCFTVAISNNSHSPLADVAVERATQALKQAGGVVRTAIRLAGRGSPCSGCRGSSARRSAG